jgi:hypothetical protein
VATGAFARLVFLPAGSCRQGKFDPLDLHHNLFATYKGLVSVQDMLEFHQEYSSHWIEWDADGREERSTDRVIPAKTWS